MLKIKSFNIKSANVSGIELPDINQTALAESTATFTDSGAIDTVQKNLEILRKDISIDACSEYFNDDCRGIYPEVDQIAESIKNSKDISPETDLSKVLEIAEIDPTDDNVKRLGLCIKSKPSYPSVTTEDIIYCAVSMKTGDMLPKAHTDKSFRDKFYSWYTAFSNFKARVDLLSEIATSEETKKWIKEYNEFRSQFIKNGGKTSAVGVREPSSAPILYWGVTLALALAGFYVFSQGIVTVAQVKAAFSKRALNE